MKWTERPDVLSYIVDCYAGTEKARGTRKRQFIWEDEDGDIVIGNSRAFTDHVSHRFSIPLTSTSWAAIHNTLHALGEVVHEMKPRSGVRGGRFKNQEPETRVIKSADRSSERRKS